MKKDFVFYATAIIVGFILSVAFNCYVSKTKRMNHAAKSFKSNPLDFRTIQHYILPNNTGKPIDDVINRLRDLQDEFSFSVDFSKRRGA